MGAEMNAQIEHASPHRKEAGEKVPGQKKKIGAAAAREYERRQLERGGVAPDRRDRPERRQPAATAVRPETRGTRASDWLIGTGAMLAARWSVLRRQQKVH